MSFQSEVSLNHENENYSLAFHFENEVILKLSFKPVLSVEVPEELPIDQSIEFLEKNDLPFNEKIVSILLLKKAIQNYYESPISQLKDIVCPCFKVSMNELEKVAFTYNQTIEEEDFKSFLMKEFPFGSACSSCMPVIESFTQNFSNKNARNSEWEGKTNVEWMKEIFLQLPEETELLDFYNGKLYLKGNLNEIELEEILYNYFSRHIKVFCTPVADE